MHHRRVKKVFDRPVRLCETSEVVEKVNEVDQRIDEQTAGQNKNVSESDHTSNNSELTESTLEPNQVRTRTGRLVNKPMRFRV